MYYDSISNTRYSYIGTSYIITRDKISPRYYKDYNCVVEWINYKKDHQSCILRIKLTQLIEVAEWCDQCLEDDWLIGCSANGFNSEEDVLAFKLRWS